MALSKLNTDLNNVQTLPDVVDDTWGTPSQLKQQYDKAGNDIKTYINSTLTSEQDAVNNNLQTQITNSDNSIASLGNRVTNTETDISNLQSTTYTKSELDNGQLDNRYFTESEIQANYYNKTFLDTKLRGGDTVIKYDVFTIVHSNNGNGTFTYNNGTQDIIGTITQEGYQRFELLKGNYIVGTNRIEATINDTLTRSVGSGGLREIGTANTPSTTVDLTIPAGDTSEVTFKYFETIGLMGEHASSHAVGGSDELIAIQSSTPTTPHAGQIYFQVV